MSVPFARTGFIAGEISPSFWGRVDQQKFSIGASTMRNMYVGYRGGAYSRAGTSWVGFSKQTGRLYPPRLIPFQFSINQGLALEFGNEYMRVVSDGGFVTEPTFPITGATNANPAAISATGFGVLSVIGSGAPGAFGTQITSSYAPGDQISIILTGGAPTPTPPVLNVTNTYVFSLDIDNAGTGYAANNVLTLVGGTGVAATIKVTSVSSGIITGFTILTNGVYTVNPSSGPLTVTGGAGTGATFDNVVMAPNAVTVVNQGAFPIDDNAFFQLSTTGIGLGAAPVTNNTSPVPIYNNGDWVFISGVTGMTQLNGETYVVANSTGAGFTLQDVFGNPINSTAFGVYTGGGAVARVYTLTTGYGEADLPFLKFTQSADVMSIACWNQNTGTSYAPMDLSRLSDTLWTFVQPNFGPTIAAPATAAATTSATGTTEYQYVTTAVSLADGSESIASPIAIVNSVDIASTAGSITVNYSTVTGAGSYNTYRAPIGVAGTVVPVGSLFGYVGTSYGAQFVDSNVVPDFAQVPPIGTNPFAPGQISGTIMQGGGVGYTQATVGYAITTGTGSGAVLTPIVVGGFVVGFLVDNPGKNYAPTDTIAITDSGGGTEAAALLQVGAATGTYPSVVNYFQERRVYAASPNNPDTYWMSEPGAFTNFDARTPTIDSDAITGTPWSVEVNGIQFMVSMPGGLVVLTGLSAWQLTGAGGSSLNPQPITPASQQAQPQAYNGISNHVPPIKINFDIIYVQAKGSIIRDLSYNFFVNIYTGQDITELSSQLFTGFTILEWAYCEEPYKIVWAVRDDGVLLSLTYLKEQEVMGWARHDTNGLYASVCSVTEPPVDALYLASQRFTPAAAAANQNCYMIERMDDRIWSDAEDVWAVDCGIELTQPTPAATLTITPAPAFGSITGTNSLIGGANYSNLTTASVVDQNGQGPGAGAVPTLTIVGGVITAVNFQAGEQGTNYVSPALVINDPSGAGSGAAAVLTLANPMNFMASAGVFSLGNVGSIIRGNGGIAVITGFTSATQVTGNMLCPFVGTIPNSGGTIIPITSGNWTLTAPTATVGGFPYLAGMTVTGLADGNVIPPTVVSAAGTIALPVAASAVVVGLGFQAQLQSLYIDAGSPTIQGQRKKISAVTARIEASRGLKMGANQPDGSVLSPQQIAPVWHELGRVPDSDQYDLTAAQKPYNSNFQPLYTSDRRIPLKGGFSRRGQVCLQQDNPLPMNVLAFFPEIDAGDLPQVAGPAQARTPEAKMRAAA